LLRKRSSTTLAGVAALDKKREKREHCLAGGKKTGADQKRLDTEKCLCYIAPSFGGKDLGQDLEVVKTNRAVAGRQQIKLKKILTLKTAYVRLRPRLKEQHDGEIKGFGEVSSKKKRISRKKFLTK
jgi:hypothetical protein